MPRTSTIDRHPQRAKINAALIRGAPFRDVARQYGVSKDALSRHLKGRLAERAAATEAALRVAEGDYIMQELERGRVILTKLYEACDRWLTDPSDPTRYSMDISHPDDITVAYDTPVGENGTKTVKVKLSELLPMLENEYRREVRMVELRRKDIREVLLAARREMRADLQLLAEIEGKIKRDVVIQFNSPAVVQLIQIVTGALKGYPEARRLVSAAIAATEDSAE